MIATRELDSDYREQLRYPRCAATNPREIVVKQVSRVELKVGT